MGQAPSDHVPDPRKGSPDPRLERSEFRRRFLSQYIDPAFETLGVELARIADAAWDAYSNHRKSPKTRQAGVGYADPTYELATDWLEAREAIQEAQRRHDDASGPRRILLIAGSSRSEHTCPSELSKSWRLVDIARGALASGKMSRSKSSSSAALRRSMGGTSIRVRRAFQPPLRSAIGPVPAIRTIPSARRMTG